MRQILTWWLVYVSLAITVSTRLDAQTTDAVSVKNYGAVGNGTTDDTAAVTAAINSGNSIYFPAGVYLVTTSLNLQSNHIYSGSGRYQTWILYTGNNNSAALKMNSSVGIKISNLGLTTSGTYTRATGIDFGTSVESTVDDVAISQFWGNSCISLSGNQNIVRNSDLENCKYGVLMTGDRNTLSHNYISNHYSRSSEFGSGTDYWDGVCAEALTNSLIDGNTVEDNGQSGIYTGGNNSVSYGNRIVNNYVFRNFNRGIDQGVSGDSSSTSSLGKLTIVGNTAIDNKELNIWINYVTGAVISGNYAEYTTNYPIYFGSFANPNRTSVGVGESGGSGTSSDMTSLVTVTGNTVIDYAGSSKICLTLGVVLGKNNVVGPNASNWARWTPPNLDPSNKLY
jgi:hypothetical protein